MHIPGVSKWISGFKGFVERATKTVLLVHLCACTVSSVFRYKALVAKMASSEQKAFCVLQFARTESVVTVQRTFCIKFQCNPPSDNNICRWYHQFEDIGCLCKGKSMGWPRLSKERVEQVRESFTCSLKKSVQKVSRELAIPVMPVWTVLRRCLQLRPYRPYAYRLRFTCQLCKRYVTAWRWRFSGSCCLQWWIDISP